MEDESIGPEVDLINLGELARRKRVSIEKIHKTVRDLSIPLTVTGGGRSLTSLRNAARISRHIDCARKK